MLYEFKTQNFINRKKKILLLIMAFLTLCVACLICYRFIRHEKAQNERISNLQSSVSFLSAKLEATKTNKIEWSDKGFNYLAIGNSITLHNECSYWWNKVGMAASDAEHDYYHLVVDYLESLNSEVVAYPYNYSVWETQSTDRDETLEFIDFLLSEKLDLVTIQLGENAKDISTFEQDYASLIKYISEKAPNAQIVVIGDFWSNGDRDFLKKKACETCNVTYVPLEGIRDNKDYYCGLGTVVYDAEGTSHVVEHSGVASHPGDEGMKAIADIVINEIKKLYNF